ncbi:hypothetical protein NKG94_11935 [Micromonospora sp. M12]
MLRDRGGVAVRLDEGNLLVFSKPPSVVADNRVLAGCGPSPARSTSWVS